MTRPHIIFLSSMLISGVVSLFLLGIWAPLLPVVIGNAVLFTMLSYRSSRFYWPSGLLAFCLIGFLMYAALVPWILATKAGTPEEHLAVARCHEAGWRFPLRSETAALRHYKIAAEAGMSEAEFAVGMAYLYRHYGEDFDREKARYWLERAAAGGDVSAQRQLPAIATIPEIK